MKDFTYYAPTEVVFGRNSEKQIPELVKRYGGTKVLIHYGGHSAEKSGLLSEVCSMLSDCGIPYVKLGGVVPNPRLSMVHKAISICRQEGVDFIIAIGGGSVIDSSKAIGYGVPYSGEVWDFFDSTNVPKACLPIGAVLTIPAAGSEMSDSCVITNEENELKRGVNSRLCRCKFAIMNPERTFTLPPFQTKCGAIDIMMHTMERYFSNEDDMTITDSIAEALMRTVKDSVFDVLKDPNDYRNRAQIMWAGSLSHNDLTGCGTIKDFGTHRLEHELSAMFDVAHGAGLSAIWCSWARYVYQKHVSRFVRFAVNVMDVTNDFTQPEATALKGIEAMENFYRSLDMPTNIHQLIGREISEAEIDTMVERCSWNGTRTVGNMQILEPTDMKAIYKMAK
jgi:alcohol dehydrogenase YqhD (iron-dependent ADH family)